MNNRQQTSSNGSKSVSGEKVIRWPWLALTAPLGYALAYSYEFGFCNFFRIPKELIQLEWTTILIAITAALGGVLILGGLYFMLFLLIKRRLGPIRWRVMATVVYFIVLLVFAVKYMTVQEVTDLLILLVFVFVYPVLLLFCLPYYTQTTVQGYRNKLLAEDKPKKDEPSSFARIITCGISALYVSFALVGIMSLEGRSKAMQEQAWHTPSTYPQSVVLRIYGENIICAPVSSEHIITVQNKSVKAYYIDEAYFVIKLSDQPPTVLKPDKVGYLRLPENK